MKKKNKKIYGRMHFYVDGEYVGFGEDWFDEEFFEYGRFFDEKILKGKTRFVEIVFEEIKSFRK